MTWEQRVCDAVHRDATWHDAVRHAVYAGRLQVGPLCNLSGQGLVGAVARLLVLTIHDPNRKRPRRL
ncbi:hypothetical protein WM40_13310 [Robbsia andropogonis]|uniref:Uncharacterized protein n=1 Tax=Robbsia andropogonis TaxID=28092 RepID=A0A0F5JZU9_9BURK|nr:hypothetical protein WM40_13310 [Robbsia andropogonis]